MKMMRHYSILFMVLTHLTFLQAGCSDKKALTILDARPDSRQVFQLRADIPYPVRIIPSTAAVPLHVNLFVANGMTNDILMLSTPSDGLTTLLAQSGCKKDTGILVEPDRGETAPDINIKDMLTAAGYVKVKVNEGTTK